MHKSKGLLIEMLIDQHEEQAQREREYQNMQEG